MRYLKYDINVFSLVILLIILINCKTKFRWDGYKYKLFISLVYSNMLLLLLDTAIFIYQGTRYSITVPLLLVSSFVYYVLNPLAPFLWAIFAEYYAKNEKPKINIKLGILTLPVLVSALISVLSISGGYYFYLDDSNVYNRGPWFPVLFIISYSYLVYAFLVICKARKRLNKYDYISFQIFAIPTTLGGILQAIFYGTSLIWPGMTVSILIIYLHIQNESMSRDYLTDIYNHSELDKYLQYRIRNSNKGNKTAGIMLDIDDFKNINDRYGHSKGDEALKNLAGILKETFRANDFVARYGGDEFVVILDINDERSLDKAVERLYRNINDFNRSNNAEYTIRISLGSAIYEIGSNMSPDEFINKIDKLMYLNKVKN